MLLIGFDWGRRTMRVGPMVRALPDGNYEDEVATIRAHFDGVTGRRAGAACAPA
jgi:hypothetical protein